MVLIPAVQFAGPLPALEAIRQRGGAEAAGLEPVGPDGRTWLARNGRPGSGVYYNALDERVQQAMTAVVAELAERYGQHASFGGVAVQLSAESYALLPDETCSLDDVTFARFLAETKTELPPSDEPARGGALELHSAAAAQAWLDWRAEKLTGLYRQMRDEVVQRPSRREAVFDDGQPACAAGNCKRRCGPSCRRATARSEILPLLGLDLSRLEDRRHRGSAAAADFAGASAAGPRPGAALEPPRCARCAVCSRARGAARCIFCARAAAAARIRRRQSVRRRQDADAAGLADRAGRRGQSRAICRKPGAARCDADDRRRLAVCRWGKRRRSRRWPRSIAGCRRSRSRRFRRQHRLSSPQELVVRTLAKGDKTYFYAVNPTPWPLTAEIQFAGRSPLRLTPYCDERQAKFAAGGRGRAAGRWKWSRSTWSAAS